MRAPAGQSVASADLLSPGVAGRARPRRPGFAPVTCPWSAKEGQPSRSRGRGRGTSPRQPMNSQRRAGSGLPDTHARQGRDQSPAFGYVIRRTWITSSRRLVIRSTSPASAASSGSSARRVVLSGPTRTSQSSNSARSPAPAWPAKVISYICDCTRHFLQSGRFAVWSIRALSLPGGWDRQHPPLGAGKEIQQASPPATRSARSPTRRRKPHLDSLSTGPGPAALFIAL